MWSIRVLSNLLAKPCTGFHMYFVFDINFVWLSKLLKGIMENDTNCVKWKLGQHEWMQYA